MNARTAQPIAALTAIAGLALSANAAIVSTSGQALQIVPPASCVPAALTGPNTYAWNEQAGISNTALPVDMVNVPGPSTSALPGFVNGAFDSHFLHFDGIPFTSIGSVTFNGPIVGVIFTNTNLDISDPILGAGGTTYPTFYPFRGLLGNPTSFFNVAGNTISFNFNNISPVLEVIQCRVLTQVPAPGAAALLAVSGGLALRRRR